MSAELARLARLAHPTLDAAAIAALLAEIPNRPTFTPGVKPVRRRRQVAPDRLEARRRRRSLAGGLPAPIAAHFSEGERAVLYLVGEEVRARGVCDRSIDELAARAGVSRSTARNALREARRLGLIEIQERRRRGRPSLTNLVRIVSSTWQAWLARGRGQTVTHHGEQRFTEGAKRPAGATPPRPHSGHTPRDRRRHSARTCG